MSTTPKNWVDDFWANNPQEMPGMWDSSDIIGGETDIPTPVDMLNWVYISRIIRAMWGHPVEAMD